MDVKRLWGLHQSVVTARFSPFGDVTQGFYDGDDGHYGFLDAGCLIAASDDVDIGERTYTVMYAHHALGIVGNQGETVLDGVETCLATVG